MLVVLIVVAILSTTGKKTSNASGGEVFLEPAAASGADPFTASVSPPPDVNPTVPATAAPVTGAPGGPVVVQQQSGGRPGLYGGTRNQGRCDQNQMISFLASNPAKAAAWVSALNSDPTLRWSGGNPLRTSQIGAYISELTPVILRTDTRVTNNGFLNGRPTPHQSVLQAGTAVLVDRYGLPRARCACGNPLLAPRAIPTTPTYTGPPWPGFSPTNVTVIQQNTTIINNFTLINIYNGQPFNRPPGTAGGSDGPATPPTSNTTARTTVPPTTGSVTTGPPPTTGSPPTTGLTVPPNVNLGSGDVQVTLLWQSSDDLDLHVNDPTNFELYYSSARAPSKSASGGQLDHDDIPGCGTAPTTHVENIFWPSGGAPAGSYQAWVNNYTSCGTPAAFELRIRVRGQIVYDQRGSLGASSGTESPKQSFRL